MEAGVARADFERVRIRAACLTALTLVVLLSAGAGTATASGQSVQTLGAANELERQMLGELNAIRRAHGLVPLRLSLPLSSAADSHSRSMATFGFFAHSSRDGSAFWKRVQRFYGRRGSGMWSVGENLLWSTTGIDATEALELWMESPGHRRNILTPHWREVGLSAVTASAAPGVFGGHDVVVITSDFGVRA
jgi:uncharacterized protein YkwD